MSMKRTIRKLLSPLFCLAVLVFAAPAVAQNPPLPSHCNTSTGSLNPSIVQSPTSTSTTITFTIHSSQVSAFSKKVFYCAAGGSGVSESSIPNTATTHTLTGLQPNTDYWLLGNGFYAGTDSSWTYVRTKVGASPPPPASTTTSRH